MERALISVIIPVYNVEEYIKECLDSVLNQTYKNIEIITINDGSTDNSLKILRNYALKNENIIVFSQENSGQSVARNKGIEMATGKYIYFLDSDDYILPETFEDLIKIMEQNNLDLIRFKADPFVDSIEMKLNKDRYNFDRFFDPNKIYNNKEFLDVNLKAFTPSPALYIIKRDILVDCNILFKPQIIHEDDLFTTEVFLNANIAMYKPKPYYKRRFRPNSTMTTQSTKWRKKSFESRCIVLNELYNLLEKYPNRHEVRLIRKNIRTSTALLIYSYEDIDKKYKKEKMKKAESLSLFLYTYYSLRRSISKRLLPIKNFLKSKS